MTYSNLNKYGSNQVKLNHAGSNNVATHQTDLNNDRFDPANLTNIKHISDSDFYFLREVLSWGSSKYAMTKQKITYGTKFPKYPTRLLG